MLKKSRHRTGASHSFASAVNARDAGTVHHVGGCHASPSGGAGGTTADRVAVRFSSMQPEELERATRRRLTTLTTG